MRALVHRHRRVFAAGILTAFLAAWVLPARACLAMGATATEASCPDCPLPCCTRDCHCAALAAQAAMLPTAVVSTQSLDTAIPAPAALPAPVPQVAAVAIGATPRGRPPAYSPPATLSIRYCRFLK